MALLEVRDLKTYFFTRWGMVKAVDGVTFNLEQGETLGLVGESGCGKSITSLSIVRLIPEPAGRIVGGQVLFEGEDLLAKSHGEMRRFRGKRIAMILQDPMASLNPVFKIGDQVAEAVTTHRQTAKAFVKDIVVDALRRVEIPAPQVRIRDYPHQLSGGMRQRVVGAIAISCEPQVLIADEPTTSLDVTVQLQYLKLLKDIQAATRVAILFITHDFGVVANLCDRVAVMYAGKIVEMGPVREIFKRPVHPYTRALIKSVPKIQEKTARLGFIEGEPPALHRLPPGCAFRPRCTEITTDCQGGYPPEITVGRGHWASCWRAQ